MKIENVEVLKKVVNENPNGFTIIANTLLFANNDSYIPKSEKEYYVLGTSNNILKSTKDIDTAFIKKLENKYYSDLKFKDKHNVTLSIGGWTDSEKHKFYLVNGLIFFYSKEEKNEYKVMKEILSVWKKLNRNKDTKQKEIYDAKRGKSITFDSFNRLILLKEAMRVFYE
jgi:hypothetical protein